MNIHNEYCNIPQNSVLQKDYIKVLGINAKDFYFLIHNKANIIYALCGSFEHENCNIIDEIAKRKPELEIKNVDKVLIMPDIFVLVPKEIMGKTEDRGLLEMVQSVPDNYKVVSSKIENSNEFMISAFEQNIIELCENLSTIKAKDLLATWLSAIYTQNKTAAHVIMFHNKFVIAIFKKGKLVLLNSFDFNDKNDFLYFLLGAIQTANLIPTEIAIRLCGDINPSSPLAIALESYFQQILYDTVECNNAAIEARMLSSILFPLFQ